MIIIAGPTASGKTPLAEYLASVFNGELINADSRQFYKGMDIGTAKIIGPTTNDLRPTTHLIDIAEPDEQITVAEYKKLAIQIIDDIQARKKLPILVGGTGLYVKAVVENLEFPRVPAQKELRAELEQKDAEELHEMLKEFDANAAKVIDKYNKRRLIRALEVSITSGESFTEQIKKGPKLYDALQIAVYKQKEILFQNIETRVEKMIKHGLEEEVRTLLKRYGWTNILATSIGYKEWQGYIEGEKSRENVIEEIIKNTKGLVKKQLTWLRRQEGIRWIRNKKEAKSLVKIFLDTYNSNYGKT